MKNLSHYIQCFLKQALIENVMMEKLNGCNFLIEDEDLLEKCNIIYY